MNVHCVVCGRFIKDDEYWECGGKLSHLELRVGRFTVSEFLSAVYTFFPHLMGFLMVHCTGFGGKIALRGVFIKTCYILMIFTVFLGGIPF